MNAGDKPVVTRADIALATEIIDGFHKTLSFAYIAPASEGHWLSKMLARHREQETLSREGREELRTESIKNAVLDLPFANTAPIEWDDADWHWVRRSLAALSTAPASPEQADQADVLREAASELLRYADLMPKETPAAGGCSTTHNFAIDAGTIWGLSERADRLRAALKAQEG